VPSGDATPSPDSASRTGGIGSDVMGDMVDMVHAAVKGDSKRATADIVDMARPSGERALCATAPQPSASSVAAAARNQPVCIRMHTSHAYALSGGQRVRQRSMHGTGHGMQCALCWMQTVSREVRSLVGSSMPI
jgi:hypothetical protein